MGFEQDYFMRMIREMVRGIGQVVLRKSEIVYELPKENAYTKADTLYQSLIDMAAQGRVNEAENLLFDEMNLQDKRYLEVALSFYLHLEGYDDKQLEESNYSREEILQGIQEVGRLYGVPRKLLNLV